MYDPTPEKLDELTPETQLRAYWLVRLAREAGIPLTIISGRRTADYNRQIGGAQHSLHLSGQAFDVQVVGYTRDQIDRSWWAALGNFAESQLGLRWGGRFDDVNHFDMGFNS